MMILAANTLEVTKIDLVEASPQDLSRKYGSIMCAGAKVGLPTPFSSFYHSETAKTERERHDNSAERGRDSGLCPRHLLLLLLLPVRLRLKDQQTRKNPYPPKKLHQLQPRQRKASARTPTFSNPLEGEPKRRINPKPNHLPLPLSLLPPQSPQKVLALCQRQQSHQSPPPHRPRNPPNPQTPTKWTSTLAHHQTMTMTMTNQGTGNGSRRKQWKMQKKALQPLYMRSSDEIVTQHCEP